MRCDECGAKNYGLDAKTGLEYINNGDACQKDVVCFVYTLYCLVRVSLANERNYHCRIVATVDCALHANLKRSNLTYQIGSISAIILVTPKSSIATRKDTKAPVYAAIKKGRPSSLSLPNRC